MMECQVAWKNRANWKKNVLILEVKVKMKMFVVLNHETCHKFVWEITEIILRFLTSAVDGGE
jgi:hypothetical protein